MKKIYFSALTFIVLCISCKKDDALAVDAVEINTNTNLNVFNHSDNTELLNELQTYAPAVQKQTKSSDKIITFTTEKGNELIFPAEAFVDGSGSPVTGNVDVSVTEITNVSEMILSGMMTNSDQGPLSSQGAFNVEVSQNGQPLKLADGSTFTIENKNAEVDKDMKGWVWEENQAVGEALEMNSGKWIRNEFDENNPCERMKSLWATFDTNSSTEHSSLWNDIKPLKDLVFTEINKITPLNNETSVAHLLPNNIYSKELFLINSNNFWYVDTMGWKNITGNGVIPVDEGDFWLSFEDWGNSYYIDINKCKFSNDSSGFGQSYSFDPNVINITFSQLSWCNIDRLLSEYGQINSCKLKGNFPSHAQVKIVFKDLNGAVSCDFSEDGFVAKRLPEGYDLTFLVYYKDGDAIKFGTQTITAEEEMTFNDANLKTLTDMDALVEEIEKIVN